MLNKQTTRRAGRPPALTTREIISVRLPRKQVEWLKQNGITETIERLVEDKMSEFDSNLLNIANKMRSELCDCDDKRCDLVNEIYNWLYNGDASGLTEKDIPDLVMEWKEYEDQQ